MLWNGLNTIKSTETIEGDGLTLFCLAVIGGGSGDVDGDGGGGDV